MAQLEEVFKLSGIPEVTFVKPLEYTKLVVALRTPGRGVIIEGPSGIGKTTSVLKALAELGVSNEVLKLSARKQEDCSYIEDLPNIPAAGIVVVDDFHRLEDDVKRRLSDYLKLLADEERNDVKLIVIGINRAGESLVKFGGDVNSRIETIQFESNPDDKIEELINLGESSLKLQLACRREIINAASGSFYIAQFLCHECCIEHGVQQTCEEQTIVPVSYEIVKGRVMNSLSRRFMDLAVLFASGTKLRREGRAPYLHILKWLADSNEWTVQLERALAQNPSLKGSVGQVVEKGYLKQILESNNGLRDLLHYSPDTRVLAVEDPQFVFFIRNLLWNKFAERVGFVNIRFDKPRDFALSFAGDDRKYAERLFQLLQEGEFEVFYDHNEQHRILANNVEEYLAPIYASEATYIICLLGPSYPKRIWTKFESEQFKKRFGENSVIPVWFTTAPQGLFDESIRYGGFTFDPNADAEPQLSAFAAMLTKRMSERAAKRALEAETMDRDEG